MPVTETDGKHTPGPWGVEYTSTALWIGPMRPDGRKVEDIVVRVDFGSDYTEAYRARQTANACLIATAPELLEAARPFDLSDWLTSGVLTNSASDGLEIKLSIEGTTYEATVTVGQLRALSSAIAKAEGRAALSKSA